MLPALIFSFSANAEEYVGIAFYENCGIEYDGTYILGIPENTTVSEVLSDEKGNITAVKTTKITFQNGKLTPVEGSEKVLPCDLLLIAAGFTGVENYVKDSFDLKTSPRNTVLTAKNHYQTENEKIFTAGDIHRGQSLVVWAIHEGKECAREVDEYLMEYTNMD